MLADSFLTEAKLILPRQKETIQTCAFMLLLLPETLLTSVKELQSTHNTNLLRLSRTSFVETAVNELKWYRSLFALT